MQDFLLDASSVFVIALASRVTIDTILASRVIVINILGFRDASSSSSSSSLSCFWHHHFQHFLLSSSNRLILIAHLHSSSWVTTACFPGQDQIIAHLHSIFISVQVSFHFPLAMIASDHSSSQFRWGLQPLTFLVMIESLLAYTPFFILFYISFHFLFTRIDFNHSPSSFGGGHDRSLSWWGLHRFLASATVCSVFWVNLNHLPSHNRRSWVDHFTCTPSLVRVPVLGEDYMVAHSRSCSSSLWGQHGRSLSFVF